jgi:hypothetical protein
MSFLNKLKIGQRLVTGFGIILVMLIALAIVSVDRVGSINNGLTAINDVNSVKQRYAINFRGSVHDRAISLRDVSLGGGRDLQANVDDINKLADNYRKSAVPLDALYAAGSANDPDELRILASIKETEAKTMPLIANARTRSAPWRAPVSVLRESTEKVAAFQEQERESAAARLRAAESMASVVTDVGEVVAAAASGDFSARLEIEHADAQMQKLVAGINEINAVVDSATSEFAAACRRWPAAT